MEENFKYKTLRRMVDEGHHKIAYDGTFVTLRFKQPFVFHEDADIQEETWENVGWKLHISLANVGDNIQRAWDLIDDLLRHEIETCKVLGDENKLPVFQWGKEITIYYQDEGVQWQFLLNEITRRFVEEGILPNYLPHSDRSVQGSQFFSFRHDEGPDGKYIDGLKAENFNPTGKAIPLEWQELKIADTNQPTRPERKNEMLLRDFYGYAVKKMGWISRDFVSLLSPFSEGLKALSPDFAVWNLKEQDIIDMCLEFPEAQKNQAVDQFKKIKKLNDNMGRELIDQSAAGIAAEKEKLNGKFKTIEGVLQGINVEIKASNVSPGAENHAAIIGGFNSGNVSSASAEGSIEGSPSKGSSEEISPRSPDDKIQGPSGKH